MLKMVIRYYMKREDKQKSLEQITSSYVGALEKLVKDIKKGKDGEKGDMFRFYKDVAFNFIYTLRQEYPSSKKYKIYMNKFRVIIKRHSSHIKNKRLKINGV
jgi:hypothetical protein